MDEPLKQEWTPEYVQSLFERGLSYVINAHNAALTAERKEHQETKRQLGMVVDWRDQLAATKQQLLSALAAIEKGKELVSAWDAQRDDPNLNDPQAGDKAYEALNQFLAIMRGFSDLSLLYEHDAEIRKEEQEHYRSLYEAHEKQHEAVRKPLVDALRKIERESPDALAEVTARDALAKVK